ERASHSALDRRREKSYRHDISGSAAQVEDRGTDEGRDRRRAESAANDAGEFHGAEIRLGGEWWSGVRAGARERLTESASCEPTNHSELRSKSEMRTHSEMRATANLLRACYELPRTGPAAGSNL